MGTVHRLASHTKHHPNTLRMKAFVTAVATLAASANSEVLVNPYLGGLAHTGLAHPGFAHPGLAYAGVPVATVEAPATIAAGPAAIAPLPVAPLTQQFHSQDEFGNTGYGYININSAKHEVGHPLVGVSGGYTFVDANNELQTVSYVADGRGFQVKATNLPTFNPEPLVAPTFNPELPVAPVDTAEVAAAKADHAAAHAEINAREKRSTPASTEVFEIKPLEVKALPLTYGTYGPFAGAVAPFAGAYAGGYAPLTGAFAPHYLALGYKAPLLAPTAAPLKAVVAAVPGAAEATLTKIKLTPGHAIAYKVE